MVQHHASPEVQARALTALLVLADDEDFQNDGLESEDVADIDQWPEVMLAGGLLHRFSALMFASVLGIFPESFEIILRLLGRLAVASRKAELCFGGGRLDLVCDAMTAFVGSAAFQAQACTLLNDVCNLPGWDGHQRIRLSGCLDNVVAAIRTHPNDLTMQATAFVALASLCYIADNRTHFLRIGGLDCILQAMATLSAVTVADIQRHCCALLAKLALSVEGQTRIISAGGLDRILAALATHTDVAEVQQEGHCALSRILAPSSEVTITRTPAAGVCSYDDVSVMLRGEIAWSGSVPSTTVAVSIVGDHVNTLTIASGHKFGLVVTPDGRYMAVSYCDEDKLRVYRLEAHGTATLLHTVGRAGAGLIHFFHPCKMCLIPVGNLLVCENCEWSNNRVQELTGLGEAEPQHVRFIPVTEPNAVALHGDTLAVGTALGIIQLLSYASGALIRSIGSSGSGPGQIGRQCEGLCFTPDGQFIVAAEYSNKRLSMFSVSDGRFVKHIGAGVVGYGDMDVHVALNGELLVADYGNHRVCVFNADGDTLLRTWGTPGSADGEFRDPIALALVDSRLFVLDGNPDSARVHVFG
jgi:DNA-binding beta-propeller fold protein YncE